ncbi:hypothetical protein HMPREF0262_02834 [Clostridium sp. ATCC 29733]|nr:hypothetical protein HMPREF0262_02834 [Clostridium sp. ATCC 29733]
MANVLLILRPVFLRQFSGHTGQLFGKIAPGHFITVFQHGCDRSSMGFFQRPQPGGTGMFTGAGIGNIEHIAQTGPVAGIVHQSNALGATAHIPAHFFIP